MTPQCCALVMLSPLARERIENTQSTSFSCDLRKWLQIMETYESGTYAYHATLPTDALTTLRNVMQESASTAVSFIRSKAERLSLDPQWLRQIDLHLHVPKHGTPKDGPSAGITMFVAVASLLLDCPVRGDLAMTGEISLRGRVMPVGGIKQKLLAAHRAGIRKIIMPLRNRRDLDEVPEEVKSELEISLVSSLEEVLPLVLLPPRVRAGDANVSGGSAATASPTGG